MDTILPSSDDPYDFPRYFKLVLGTPDFQHDNHAQVLITTEPPENASNIKPPYTPEIQSLKINYETDQVFQEFNQDQRTDIEFYHISPFGHGAPCLPPDKPGQIPAPTFFPMTGGNEGTLMIGLRDVAATEMIDLLFQLLPGTTGTAKPAVKWSYLDHNCWIPFEEKAVLIDQTDNLIKTGLIKIKLPKSKQLQQSAMPDSLFWLKATTRNNAGSAGEIIGIYANAAIAEWIDNGNTKAHLATPLPPLSIKALEKRDPAIKSLTQPYSSFGGKLPEPDHSIFTRGSERLRHKNRALTHRDYEQLVLEHFPEVYKAKCLQPWEMAYIDPKDEKHILQPGNVVLIVIPNIADRAPFFPLEPKIDNALKQRIEDYLKDYASPFAKIHVRNPRYEKIRYRMDIRFHDAFQDEFYRQQLNQDIQRFLSPWAYEAGADISFGSRIYHSTIIHFIEQLPYVDFVVNFKLVRQYKDDEKEYGCMRHTEGFATASHPDTILVSHPEHFIGNVKEANYDPKDYIGIGYERIGVDHII
jgi:hypothetical protein